MMAVPEDVRAKIVAQIPTGRLGTPDEILIAGRLADAAINHQVAGSLGHLRVQVIHQHSQRRLG